MIPQDLLLERVGLIEAGLVKAPTGVTIRRAINGRFAYVVRGGSESAILERGPIWAHDHFKASCILCYGKYDPSIKTHELPKPDYIYQTTYTDGNGY